MKKFRAFQKIKNVQKRFSYILVAIALVVSSVAGSLTISPPTHAAIGSITEYSIPIPWQPQFNPRELAVGPDNQIWHTGINRISKVTTAGNFTQYLRGLGVNASGVVAGADGNMWFGESNYILKMATNGTVLGTYSIPSGKPALRMVLGPDDAVWFTLGNSGYVGKVTTTGVITEYIAASTVTDITAGPDGNMWFTYESAGSSNNGVGKMTTSGVRTLYTIPAPYSARPQSITTGPDGNLWYTQTGASRIGKITTSGIATDYSLPTTDITGPYGITAGSDGSLWFTASAPGNTSRIGRMSTSGTLTNIYNVSAPGGSLRDIIAGNDGAVWYVSYFTDKVGRVATELYDQTISFTSAAPTGVVVDGPNYTPTATATSNLLVDITVDSSSSGVCSIDGSGKVSFQGAGTCTLNANQAGNVDYNPAPQVQQSFAVAPVESDISVEVDCPPTAFISGTVNCTITVFNDGPAVAENVSLTALFSNSFSGVSLSGSGTLSGQTITWAALTLDPEDSIELTFSGMASLASRASLSAAVLQTNPDSNISNNVDDAKILIN